MRGTTVECTRLRIGLRFAVGWAFVCCVGPETSPNAQSDAGRPAADAAPDAACTCGNGSPCDVGGKCTTPGAEGGIGGVGVALRGGSIVDPRTKSIDQRDLFLCGGVVVDATAARSCTLTDVDVTGKFLVPGLHDMHVHARGVSLGDGNFNDITVDAEAATFRIAGVTSFLDAMNDEAKIFPIRDAQRTKGLYPGADIFASGGAFTPTGGHGTEYGLPTTSYHIVDTTAEVTTQLALLAKKKPDYVKIFYDHRGADGGPDVKDGQMGALGIAMSKGVMQALVAGCNAMHLPIEVHIGAWQDARDAMTAGAPIIAHLGEPLVPDDVVAMAVANHVHWIPTISLYRGLPDVIADPTLLDDPLLEKVATPDVLTSYRPANLNVDPYTTAWLARHVNDAQSVAKLYQAGVSLVTGTDVVELGIFIGWSLHREMKLLVEYGLSPWDALAAATVHAGELLGKDYGIEPGAEGSVVVLDASPIDDIWNTTKIAKVVHHGDVVPMP